MIAFDWPHTHTEPLSSELTIVRPSGLIDFVFTREIHLKFRNLHIEKPTIYLNKHERMASPFSCDKIFVFDPSARSHKMIVPSTDADAKTPP